MFLLQYATTVRYTVVCVLLNTSTCTQVGALSSLGRRCACASLSKVQTCGVPHAWTSSEAPPQHNGTLAWLVRWGGGFSP